MSRGYILPWTLGMESKEGRSLACMVSGDFGVFNVWRGMKEYAVECLQVGYVRGYRYERQHSSNVPWKAAITPHVYDPSPPSEAEKTPILSMYKA